MKYTPLIMAFFSGIFIFTFAYMMNRSILEIQAKTQELIKQNDSLQNELHISKSIIGRYEMGLYEFAEQDPKSCKKFISIIENETE